MFLPNQRQRQAFSKLRAARRKRQKHQPLVQALERRELLSTSPSGVTIAPLEDQVFQGTVATFTAGDAGPFGASIDWGDGTATAGTVTANASGGFNVEGTHTYAEDGTGHISVTIVDAADSTTATAASTADISEGAFGLTAGQSINATEGVAQTGINVATFSDPGSPDAAGDYAATVEWGDGTTSAGTVSGSAGKFTVTAGHTYAEDGVYPIAITVTENGVMQQGSAASAGAFATVSENDATLTASSISVAEGQTFAGKVASLTDPGSSDPASFYLVEINWGDGTTSLGDIIGSNGSFTVNGTHQYADDGHYTIGLRASEGGAPPSPIATATGDADVSEDDLAVAEQAIQAAENTPFKGTIATFTDATAAAGDLFTATVSWGDGHGHRHGRQRKLHRRWQPHLRRGRPANHRRHGYGGWRQPAGTGGVFHRHCDHRRK